MFLFLSRCAALAADTNLFELDRRFQGKRRRAQAIGKAQFMADRGKRAVSGVQNAWRNHFASLLEFSRLVDGDCWRATLQVLFQRPIISA